MVRNSVVHLVRSFIDLFSVSVPFISFCLSRAELTLRDFPEGIQQRWRRGSPLRKCRDSIPDRYVCVQVTGKTHTGISKQKLHVI